MNELANSKTMTVKEVAEQTGAAYRTVAEYTKELFPELVANGKATHLNEAQVTIILEKMKMPVSSGTKSNLAAQTQGIETTKSRALRIDLLHRQIEEEMSAELAELRAENAEMKPKAEFFNQVADSRDALQMRDVAATLNLTGWGRNNIFKFLREHKVLDDRNVPYREFEDRGYFRVIEQKWTDPEGETRVSLKTLVYQKGVDYIRRLIPEGSVPVLVQ
jgi:phage antirepressor YoqD-like protein